MRALISICPNNKKAAYLNAFNWFVKLRLVVKFVELVINFHKINNHSLLYFDLKEQQERQKCESHAKTVSTDPATSQA